MNALAGCAPSTTVALTSVSGSRRPGLGMQDSSTASLRGRALLLPDDIIRPERGHVTVFAAYGEGGRAEQAIFHAELTPFFRRKDWKLDGVQPTAPTTAPRLPRPNPAASAPATSEPTGKPPQTSEPEPEGLDRDLELTEALTQFEVEGL